VNAFLWAAMALLLGLVPCGAVCLRARVIDGVVALLLAGSVTVTALICLAQGLHSSSAFDVPVVAALAVWISGMIFARFMGRFLS